MIRDALKHEISIYQKFNNFTLIDDFIAFYSPDTEQVPHWNLVYDPNGNTIPRNLELRMRMSDFYSARGLVGHAVQFELDGSDICAENSEYFYKEYIKNSPSVASLEIHSFDDAYNSRFHDFLNIMNNAFNFDRATANYFSKKMEMIVEKVETTFHVGYENNIPVATGTTYLNCDGTRFMFNIGVSKKFQGKGISSKFIHSVCSSTQSGIFTYSHNPIMRNNVLSSVGFQSLGSMYCVPLIR